MRKTELCGMKKLPSESRQFGVAHIKFRRGAIERVSDKRMLHCGEVHTDLMRSTCVELDLEQSRGSKSGEFAPLGASRAHAATLIAMVLARLLSECFHARAVDGIAANRQLDFASSVFELAFDERDVGFFYGAGAKRFGQFSVGIVVFCDDDEAGGLFIKTVHDSGAQSIRLRTATRKILSPTQERVYQRAAGIPCAGMHAHAGGFVDDEQVVVFVEDVQWNGFGFGPQWQALPRFDDDLFAAAKFQRCLRSGTVH